VPGRWQVRLVVPDDGQSDVESGDMQP
jgi:hypothetical protein